MDIDSLTKRLENDTPKALSFLANTDRDMTEEEEKFVVEVHKLQCILELHTRLADVNQNLTEFIILMVDKYFESEEVSEFLDSVEIY